MSVLLTGGTGYIGSHTAVELLEQGEKVILVDNLYNSEASVADRIAEITGVKPTFYEADVADKDAMRKIFATEQIDAIIHFAGLKAVGESVEKPVEYYRNNLDTTLTLLELMKEFDCKCFVFSSSATVYGMHNEAPFTETMPVGNCTNPYGWTKYFIEQILTDTAKANPEWSVVLLRYFNPVGAHPSGLLGEKPSGIPNNLMPYIMQTAAGIRDHLSIFGDDYPTPDGTGVRDYIHVVDLAKGHLSALQYGRANKGTEIFNLGTGKGISVLELVESFKKVNQVDVPYEIVGRRAGDIATCYADTAKAEKMLHWTAGKTVEDMCRDSWNWQQRCK